MLKVKLQEIKDQNTNLYEHLNNVLTKILLDNPKNAFELFEDYSLQVKSSGYTFSKHNEFDNAQRSQVTMDSAVQQKTLKLINKINTGTDEEPVEATQTGYLPNLPEEAQLFEWAGVGIDENYKIFKALTLLSVQKQATRMRFWGKIMGREKDYYIAEGLATSTVEDGELPPEKQGVLVQIQNHIGHAQIYQMEIGQSYHQLHHNKQMQLDKQNIYLQEIQKLMLQQILIFLEKKNIYLKHKLLELHKAQLYYQKDNIFQEMVNQEKQIQHLNINYQVFMNSKQLMIGFILIKIYQIVEDQYIQYQLNYLKVLNQKLIKNKQKLMIHLKQDQNLYHKINYQIINLHGKQELQEIRQIIIHQLKILKIKLIMVLLQQNLQYGQDQLLFILIKYYNNFIMDMVLKQQPIIFIQKNHNQYNQNGQIFQNNQNPISQQKCHNNNKSDKYYQIMEQEDTSLINITITESVITKHVAYVIKGEDRIGSYEANRRYNDFFVLRLTLLQRWPGCYIPPIPSKQALGNNEPKVVEDRKRFLQYFLEQVSKLRHIYFSDEFQTFLRTKNTDMEKALQGLPKQSIPEVYEKFKKNFPHLNGKEINSDLVMKVSSFSTYLGKCTKQLETLKEQVKLLANAKKQYTDQFNNMTQVIVPEYEKNILIEYVNHKTENLIFTNHNDVNAAAREIKDQNNQTNNYDYLVDLLRIECKEVEAFQETLQQKDYVEKMKQSAQQKLRDQNSELVKLQAGKTTFKSMFSKGSNTEQATLLEKKIQDTQNEIKILDDLCILITSILCFDEIDRFKKNKQVKYYEILIKVSQLEQQLNSQYIKFWSEVAKGTEAEVVV